MPRKSPKPDPWSLPLTRPIQIRGGPLLTTLLEASAYMLDLPEGIQHRSGWQHAAQLVMAAAESGGRADIEAVTRQLDLMTFVEGRQALT